jgi:nucleolin
MLMHLLIKEHAKKPDVKPLVVVAKNGSKTVKQESSSDEDSSEDESNDDSDDVS